MMKSTRDQRGSILLEAVIAVALLIMFALAVTSLAVTAAQGTGKAVAAEQALWRAEEGLSALATMAYDDLVPTDPAILNWNGTSWSVASGSAQDVGSGMTRTVRILEVLRDANCLIAQSGDVDPDTREIISEVFWTDPAGRSQTTSLSKIRTHYDNPQSSCFAEQASQVQINFLQQAEWFGQKQLRHLYVDNLGALPVTVVEIEYEWDNAELIQQSFFNTTKVWSASGPGTPSGEQPSDTDLDIQDYTIPAGTTMEINKTQFTGNMLGTTVKVEIKFLDGSELESDPFVPTW
jgi:type II secretory pathway pseudopilin PulG